MGGVQNFEEYNLRPYRKIDLQLPIDPAIEKSFGTKVGDTVVVACVSGRHQEGVILGGISHPGRETALAKGDIAYINQFNGIETKIDSSGTYTLTNKALLATALDTHVAGTPIPPEVSDPTAAGNFLEINSDGSITVSDGAKQSIVIDKTGLNTTITSGSCSITLNALESAEFVAPAIKMTAKMDITTSALNTKMESKLGTSIKTMKFAVGNSSFELIDGLIKLIDALGALVVMSPAGPCNPLQGAPTWTQVMILKTKLTAFKGSL